MFENLLAELVASLESYMDEIEADHSHRTSLGVFEVEAPGKQGIVDAGAFEDYLATVIPLYPDGRSNISLCRASHNARSAIGPLTTTLAAGQCRECSNRHPSS